MLSMIIEHIKKCKITIEQTSQTEITWVDDDFYSQSYDMRNIVGHTIQVKSCTIL